MNGLIEPLFVVFGTQQQASAFAAERRLTPLDYVSADAVFAKSRVENTTRRIIIVSMPRPEEERDLPELREIYDLATRTNLRNGFTRPEVRHV